MAFSVVMPALEMAQETGKLLAWRKKDGDHVAKGEPLLEIETDKAVVEVESPADGILAGIKASEGDEIPVGRTIAWILAAGETIPSEPASSTPAARANSASKEAVPHAKAPVALQSAVSAKISPKARRLAQELGVDIASIRGSGPAGEILASDIQAAAISHKPEISHSSPPNFEVPSTLGRIMAERTTQSWTTIPHFFVTRDVDASALNQYRDRIIPEIESVHKIRISHTDLLVATVSRVLANHPRLNASWSNEGIRTHNHVNMAVAIAVDDGVVAGVIPNANKALLHEIAVQRREITERARAGKLRPADISDGTFTISNLGMYAVDQFSAIVTPPQAAILAVGRIAERVVAVKGKPEVRPIMTLTVSCDHRVVDGARAARFLAELTEAFQKPANVLQ